ncbi:MAG TPA: LysR family transcriptional regulator [Thermoleophilaceae bacterium]|nr:LysR family transcriptional regulator [Thermoleophilaceae bacterium]
MAANGWLRLELRYLAALEAIAATGSFGGAADELGYTQSAVSQQIAALERLVGRPLIDRPGGRRPVGLTAAGSLLLEHGTVVLARLRMAQAQLQALDQGDAGTLRVGTYQSVGVRVLPGVAASVAETYPDLRLEIHEAGCDLDLVDRVRHGALDVTFCVLPVPGSSLETEELMEDPYLLLVPADSPLLEAPEVPLQILSSLPLIGYRGCRTQERVDSYLRGLGIDLHRVAYAGDNAIIQGMVAAGRGVALLTRLAIDETDPRTATLPLEGWVPPRRVGLGWVAEQVAVPGLKAFVETAREVTRARREPIRPAA